MMEFARVLWGLRSVLILPDWSRMYHGEEAGNPKKVLQ